MRCAKYVKCHQGINGKGVDRHSNKESAYGLLERHPKESASGQCSVDLIHFYFARGW